ncbi:MAG TPA: septum formation inhibitor Maf [Sutterella sp.]|nr:septum formation inhibitor Maf [Sutterella sp.]
MTSLYLASKSPRRKQILEQMGITDIRLLAAGRAQLTAYEGDETQGDGERAEDYVIRTSRIKAMQAFARIRSEALPSAPVLAADTIVVLDGQVLGKPRNVAEARDFMQRLSGRTHEVRTAVSAGTDEENLKTLVSVSRVTFCTMTEGQIEGYIASPEPYDKAGGYGIQGLAGLFISSISGSYSGIMGLPVFETAELLRPFGLTRL